MAFAVEQMRVQSLVLYQHVTCKKSMHTLEIRLCSVAGFNFQLNSSAIDAIVFAYKTRINLGVLITELRMVFIRSSRCIGPFELVKADAQSFCQLAFQSCDCGNVRLHFGLRQWAQQWQMYLTVAIGCLDTRGCLGQGLPVPGRNLHPRKR